MYKNGKIQSFLNIKNIKYEFVKLPQVYSDFEIEIFANGYNVELANAVILVVDGIAHYAFISANYNIDKNRLKIALDANQLDIILDYQVNNLLLEDIFTNDGKIFIDKNLADDSEEIFLKTESKFELIKVRTSQLIGILESHVVDLLLLPKYKVKVSFVSPVSNRNEFEKHEKCFFGVSLQNSHFTRSKIMASLEWISKRFSSCSVLIGDSIHRITLEIINGIDSSESNHQALFLGKEFLHREIHIFRKFEKLCNFDFIFCSQVQNYPEYSQYYTSLKNLFDHEHSFQTSVKSFSENYHQKRKTQLDQQQWEYQISRSNQYFLEEFAIFACLRNRNLPVMIYPGSFSTLTEIADGKHPNVLQELKDLTVVSLQLKKR